MATEYRNLVMATSIRVSMKVESQTAKANIHGLMEAYSKAHLNVVSVTDTVDGIRVSKVVTNMRVCIRTIENVVMEYSNGVLATSIKVNFLMTYGMGKAK